MPSIATIVYFSGFWVSTFSCTFASCPRKLCFARTRMWCSNEDKNISIVVQTMFRIGAALHRFTPAAGAARMNPAPGSSRHCRPIKFLYEKETTACILRWVELVKSHIKDLNPVRIVINENAILMHYDSVLTVVNGNALTGAKSMQNCFVCQAWLFDMSKISGRVSLA